VESIFGFSGFSISKKTEFGLAKEFLDQNRIVGVQFFSSSLKRPI
jgi:hypothetical protein